MEKFIQSIFQVKSLERTKWQIVLWWEYRRIVYNIIVLVAGIISILIMASLDNVGSGVESEIEGGVDEGPFGIIIFGIMCNLCYTLGWFTEIFIPKNVTYGPIMFKLGLGITLLWVMLPAILLTFIKIFQ